jgi:hypothetical protein
MVLIFKFRVLALLVTFNMYVQRLLTDLLMKIKVVWHVIPCRREIFCCGNHFKSIRCNIPETRVISKGIQVNKPKQVALEKSIIRLSRVAGASGFALRI